MSTGLTEVMSEQVIQVNGGGGEPGQRQQSVQRAWDDSVPGVFKEWQGGQCDWRELEGGRCCSRGAWAQIVQGFAGHHKDVGFYSG